VLPQIDSLDEKVTAFEPLVADLAFGAAGDLPATAQPLTEFLERGARLREGWHGLLVVGHLDPFLSLARLVVVARLRARPVTIASDPVESRIV